MLVLYISIIIVGFLVCIFFLTRSLITLFSFFSKSPFVPLEKVLIEKGLENLELKEGDRFVDIGCGDGRVVFSCAKKYPNLRCYKGIEIIFILVYVAKFKKLFFRDSFSKSKVSFDRENAVGYSYDQFNKVFMYLLPDFVSELMPKLEKELPSKSIVVSVAFKIPDIYQRSGNLEVKDVKFGRKSKKIYIWKKK